MQTVIVSYLNKKFVELIEVVCSLNCQPTNIFILNKNNFRFYLLSIRM